jgi:large subunit ribosomal protein L25
METIILSGQMREGRGKGACRQLRRKGMFPGVLYGGEKNVPISIDLEAFQSLLSSGVGENTVFQFNFEGEDKGEHQVLIRELQIHPVTRAFLHVDLYEVSMDKEIAVDVPIVLADKAVGVVQEGGILHHQLKGLSIECLPALIPEHIAVDVSGLHIGNVIHVRDLELDKDIKVLTDPDKTVVSIAAPLKEEAPTEEAPVEEPPSAEEEEG